jgi:hypothetical protein
MYAPYPSFGQGWSASVQAYARAMRKSLGALRTLEAGGVARWAGLRGHFLQFLARPCPELTLPLRHYQHHHNHVGWASPAPAGQLPQVAFSGSAATALLDLAAQPPSSGVGPRNDPAVQAELALRLEDTVGRLWDALDGE